jgi:hypothetical protein
VVSIIGISSYYGKPRKISPMRGHAFGYSEKSSVIFIRLKGVVVVFDLCLSCFYFSSFST